MDDIKDLALSFKEKAKVQALIKRNQELEAEVKHLKEMLNAAIPNLSTHPVERIIQTPEEILIERQIELIQNRGIDHELTLEDTKKLDLLLKNKNLIRENQPVIEIPKPALLISKQEMLLIAERENNSGTVS